MPSIEAMRRDICRIYDYKPGWLAKVNAMPDYQVMAIWHRFKSQGMDPEVIKKNGCRSITTRKLAAKQEADRLAGRNISYEY